MHLLYMQPKQHQKLLCSTRVNIFDLKIIVRNIKAKLILQNATRVFMFTKKNIISLQPTCSD